MTDFDVGRLINLDYYYYHDLEYFSMEYTMTFGVFFEIVFLLQEYRYQLTYCPVDILYTFKWCNIFRFFCQWLYFINLQV